MGRRKVPMGLIPNRRLRATTFAKRKTGLMKKASDLATLCGVRVAVVACADGAPAADACWESEPGVLDAYRDLPPEERARHTRRAYAELELRKEEAKLVRARLEGPAALAPEDAVLYGLTLDEARRMLAVVDDVLRAADDRRAALGLPAHDDDGNSSWLKVFAATGASDAPLPFVGSSSSVSIHGYLQGNTNDTDGALFDPCMNWQSGYAFQQCTAPDMDGYNKVQTDMYGNSCNSIGRLSWGDAFHAPTTNAAVAMMQPAGYGGFECTGTGSSRSYDDVSGKSSYYLTQQQVPPSNAIVPLGYDPSSLEMGLINYNYLDGVAQAAAQQGSNFFAAAPALSLTMGTGDSLLNEPQPQPLAVMSYNGDLVNAGGDYPSDWPAGLLQRVQR